MRWKYYWKKIPTENFVGQMLLTYSDRWRKKNLPRSSEQNGSSNSSNRQFARRFAARKPLEGKVHGFYQVHWNIVVLYLQSFFSTTSSIFPPKGTTHIFLIWETTGAKTFLFPKIYMQPAVWQLIISTLSMDDDLHNLVSNMCVDPFVNCY